MSSELSRLKYTPREPIAPSILPSSTAFDRTPLYPHSAENCFSDDLGRTILLRGLNVGGCSKVPSIEPGQEHVKYSGKPFKSVQEADEWWARLRLWGVGVIRWVITWEAVEPDSM